MRKPVKIMGNWDELSAKKKVNEDLLLLKIIEDLFIKKRGYIVKMPKPGNSVVACLSGGQDSVANIGILLKDFKLNVYPFFINRGQSNYKYEKKAVNYFNNFYKKKFPSIYHDYKEIKINTPGLEYKNLLRETQKNANKTFLERNIAYPARGSVIFLTGMEYGYSLKCKGIKIKTLFASNMSSDPAFHCSQTWIRIMNLLFCQTLNDWSWQFISIPIEKEFKNCYDKDVFIKWAYENDIPLHKARTCMKSFNLECGTCFACQCRRNGYARAGIKDPTKYISKI